MTFTAHLDGLEAPAQLVTPILDDAAWAIAGDGAYVIVTRIDGHRFYFPTSNLAYWEVSMKSKDDAVNNPAHYKLNERGIEAIDAIRASMTPAEFQGYLKGNTLKYLWRYRYKGAPLEDLQKARWYLDRLIEETADE